VAYTVELKPATVRDWKKLDRTNQKRSAQVIESLQTESRPSGTRKVQYARNLYHSKVGDYRILYQIDDDSSQVLVLRIRHRREVYRPKMPL
jgi:mRNA interferase RelE/StbE